jgi:hypothetical protein
MGRPAVCLTWYPVTEVGDLNRYWEVTLSGVVGVWMRVLFNSMEKSRNARLVVQFLLQASCGEVKGRLERLQGKGVCASGWHGRAQGQAGRATSALFPTGSRAGWQGAVQWRRHRPSREHAIYRTTMPN